MEVDYIAPDDVRVHLITESLKFVLAARKLPGITRITLIGSLTTDKKKPKDADLLLTVKDDMDLEPLARIGRRLKGHAQNINCGADIFLVNPENKYLGRVCHWRACEPGIRMRCYAHHCGRRQYLYDDLKIIKLNDSLIAEPPLELWPEVIARVAIPRDVEQYLILPLKHDLYKS